MNGRDGDREVPMSEERDIVVLPDQTLDDTDEGWGDRFGAERDRDSEERLIADRPPHWDH
ncbi:MAG TPA: hypothetical protein VGO94_11430 [Mycobacteriales bacterium]|nr:hypothetical protein [Cryptosporangiaceae bacterium]MDQ1679081.1 hypothetical protein [Actinomycetota bacterium]HEV7756457.1 hypothetical protein [Mycobacteriales bacterium]